MNISNNKVDIIYHISDVHIMPYKNRNDFIHFDDVFSKFTSIINDDNRSKLLVITGDIFDNKEKITATSLRKFQEYMENIKCEKIIIAGNHDKNLNMIDAIDTIEPTISGYKDIHYLQFTGVYSYGDIDFYVDSVLDNEDIKVENKTNKYNIVLYHGMLKPSGKSRLDNYKDRSIKLDDSIKKVRHYGNYDYMLLGDIHKRQYMNDNKSAWYAGSIVQKNYGESISGHGYVILDLVNNKHKFKDIVSDYGYVNVTINSNGYIFDDSIENIPKNIKIKYKIHKDVEDRDSIIKTLKEDNTDKIIIEEKMDIIIKKEEETIIDEIERRENVNESVEINNYILNNLDKIEKESGISRDRIKNIKNRLVELHKRWCEETEEITNANKYEIKYIEFKNLFKYGGNKINRIEFRDGLYNVFGTNGIGKSTIIRLVIFALFGVKNDDIKKLEMVVNRNKRNKMNDNYIEIGIKIREDVYVIKRDKIMLKKMNNEYREAKYDSVKLMKNNVIITTDRNNIDKMIENIIGDSRNFMNLSVINEREKLNFVNTSDIERLKVFESMLGLHKYENIETKVKKELTQNKKDHEQANTEYTRLLGMIDGINKSGKEYVDGTLELIDKNIKELDKKYNNIRDNNNKLEEERKNEMSKLKKVIKLIKHIDEVLPIDDNKDDTIKSIKELEDKLESYNDKLITIGKTKKNKLILEEEDIDKYKIIDINTTIRTEYNDEYIIINNIEHNDTIYYDNEMIIRKLEDEIIGLYSGDTISKEEFMRYKSLIKDINKIYVSGEYKSKSILPIEDIELRDMREITEELEEVREKLKKNEEILIRLDNEENITENKIIKSEKDVDKGKKRVEEIVYILDNKIGKNTLSDHKVDITRKRNRKKLLKEKDLITKRIIQNDAEIKQIKNDKKCKSNITSKGELEIRKVELEKLRMDIKRAEYTSTLEYSDSIKEMMGRDSIEIEYLVVNIDGIYKYISEKTYNKDNNIKILEENIDNYIMNSEYERKRKLKQDNKELKDKLELINRDIIECEHEYNVYNDELLNYKKWIKHEETKKKIIECINNIDEYKKLIDNRETVLYNIEYYRTKITRDIGEYIDKKKVKQNRETIKKLKEENENIVRVLSIIVNNNRIIEEEIDNYRKNIERVEIENKVTEVKRKLEEKRIIKNKIDKYEEYKRDRDNNIKYECEQSIIENRLQEIDNKIDRNMEIEYKNNIIRDREIYKDEIKKRDDTNRLMNELKNKETEQNNKRSTFELNKVYSIIINKNNYPGKIIEEYISNIEVDINKYINYFMEDKIVLRKTEKKVQLYKINKDGGEISLSTSSAYEMAVLCIILKIILVKQNINARSDIFIIDEVMDVISNKNYDKIGILMMMIKNTYKKIIIISHNEEIKKTINDSVTNNHTIKIEESDGVSFIV